MSAAAVVVVVVLFFFVLMDDEISLRWKAALTFHDPQHLAPLSVLVRPAR